MQVLESEVPGQILSPAYLLTLQQSYLEQLLPLKDLRPGHSGILTNVQNKARLITEFVGDAAFAVVAMTAARGRGVVGAVWPTLAARGRTLRVQMAH